MAEIGKTLTGYVVGFIVLAFALFASAEQTANGGTTDDFESDSFFKLFNLLLHKAKMHYQHFWPVSTLQHQSFKFSIFSAIKEL